MISKDTLVIHGGELKVLANGNIGGYLVVFGNPDKPDLAGDFFTADTDFGVDFDGGPVKSLVYFDHGLDPVLGIDPVGVVELKKDAKGVWAEGQLKAREAYSAAVKEIIGKDLPELIAGKKLGWSSGTAPHLVARKKVGAANWIKSWPLGLDASLTATPCEPRTLAVPLKSWEPSFVKGVHLGPRAEVGAAMSAIQHLHSRLHDATWDAMADEKATPKARMAKISKGYDECKDLCMKCMKSLLGGGDEPADEPAAKSMEMAEVLSLEADLIELELDSERFRVR